MRDGTRFRIPLLPAAAVGAIAAVLCGSPIVACAAAGVGTPHLTDLDGPVSALLVYHGDLVAGGEFTGNLNGDPVRYLARWRNGSWEALGSEPDAPVRALAVLQDQIVAGGEFESIGSLAARHVARWDGTQWAALGEGTDGPVHALLVQADVILYVGGSFTTAGGHASRSVARWISGSWSPLGAGLEGQVNALELFNGGVVAGGEFVLDSASPHSRNLARFVGSAWQPMAPGISGRVSALTIWNGMLVAGGNFIHIDYVTRTHHVAGFSSDTWTAVGFGFGELDTLDTSEVRALCVDDGELIAGGDFTVADLRPAYRVARFDGADWWPIGTGTDGPIETFAVDGGVLYAGGSFASAGGTVAGAVAGYAGADWRPLGTVPVAVEDLQAIATPAGVDLRWTLSREAVAGLRGVRVERAPTAPGPYVPRTATPIVPEVHMSFVDAGVPADEGSWFYRLVLIERQGSEWICGPVEVRTSRVTTAFVLADEPGPGRPVAFVYRTGGAEPVRLVIFDVRGRILRRLDAGLRPAGSHIQHWDRLDATGGRASRGVYFVQLRAGGFQATKKLVLEHD